MNDNKVITILSYILIGILLLPIIAIGLYVGIGAILFYILLIIDRIKNGKSEPKEGKPFKTVSAILALITTAAAYFIFKPELNIFNWKTFLIVQGVVFISLLPICLYKYLKIKHKIYY